MLFGLDSFSVSFFLRLVLPTCLACGTASSKCTAFRSCSLSFSFYNLLLVSRHPKKAEGLKLSCLFRLQFRKMILSPLIEWEREGSQWRHGCVSEAWSALLLCRSLVILGLSGESCRERLAVHNFWNFYSPVMCV